MTGFWISVLVFSTMYPVQSGRHRVTAQSSEPDVYQPDKKLIVDIGASVTLQCYIFEVEVEEMIFFKQQNRKQPRIIVRFFNAARETFYNEFQNPRFQIKKHTNCFNLTILNTALSDEAVYYCALTRPDPVFGEGTDLKFKGQSFTTESETSKPALCDHNTNMNTQEKTEVSPGTRQVHVQESVGDSLTYEASQMLKRKVKPGGRDDLVYSHMIFITTSVHLTAQLTFTAFVSFIALVFISSSKSSSLLSLSLHDGPDGKIQSNLVGAGLLHNPSQIQEFISLIKSSVWISEAQRRCSVVFLERILG
ncbi:uncharacterized protein LOC132890343 [Neoarius graeffei]|uniref:uncharacterized protein LOC132890343 n=1 Tax=Neoarius graeffei TaxID=443677 RepID=UPI00298C0EC5|nr:uncharacterized protein LOC132890343 [Neoarius graeffei]